MKFSYPFCRERANPKPKSERTRQHERNAVRKLTKLIAAERAMARSDQPKP